MLISGGKVLAIDELLLNSTTLTGDGVFTPLGVVGFLTESQADLKYQPKGNYATNETLAANYLTKQFITTNYYTKSETYNRDYINGFFQPKGDYATPSDIGEVRTWVATNYYNMAQVDGKVNVMASTAYVNEKISLVNMSIDNVAKSVTDTASALEKTISDGDNAISDMLAGHTSNMVMHLTNTEHAGLTDILTKDFSKYMEVPSLDDGFYTLHSLNGVNSWSKARSTTGENGLSSTFLGTDNAYHVGLDNTTTATLNRVTTSAGEWDKITEVVDVKMVETNPASYAKNTVYFKIEEVGE